MWSKLFTSEALEKTLAQAKVQLAGKLGQSVEWIENNTNVPVTDSELWVELGIDYTAIQTIATSTVSETTDSNESNDAPSEEELEDFFKDLDHMMDDIYRWWAQNNGGGNSSWQELYEWWAQNNGGGNSSWQELYEWWAQNNGGGNSSWARTIRMVGAK